LFANNPCIFYIYSSLLFAIMIMEIGAGVTAYIYSKQLDAIVGNNMKYEMRKYVTELAQEDGTETKAWDFVQKRLECCGVNKKDDWLEETKLTGPPLSCNCMPMGNDDCDVDGKWSIGCLTRLEEEVIYDMLDIITAAFIVAVVQVIGVITACCFAKRLKKKGDLFQPKRMMNEE